MSSGEDRLRLARTLESTARALGGTLGAEMMVYASDHLRGEQTGGAEEMADALLVRARQMDPDCHLAVDRTLHWAAERGDWLVLADALAQASQLVPTAEAQAMLIVQRAEVLGRWLGRLDEARRLYAEAASLSSPIAGAALAAADELESRAAGRIPHDAGWPEVVPARPTFDPLVGAGMPTASRADEAVDAYRRRLAEGYDGQLFADAVAEAVDRGVVDAARRVLPGVSRDGRSSELVAQVAAAEASGDHDRARQLRAAAFAEAPESAEYYAAARSFFGPDRLREARIEVLLRRRRVVEDPAEVEAIVRELGRLAAEAGYPTAAGEAYLELLRSPALEDWAEVLALVEPLSKAADDARLWSRALGAATARPSLPFRVRHQLLLELAHVLEEDLGDEPTATALRAELAVVMPPAPSEASVRPEAVQASAQQVRAVLLSGDLAQAVRIVRGAGLDRSSAFALWLEIAELAEVLGQYALARVAYLAAAPLAETPEEQERARIGRARVAGRLGARREAAAALAGLAPARQTARAHLAAKDVSMARVEFGRALDQDPTDVFSAAYLARLHAEDGNRRTVEQLADAMAGHAMEDDRRAAWLTELAYAQHRLGDHSAARRDFVKAMRLDVANTDAAAGLVTLGVDANEASWMDEGLSSLRARWAARGEWLRAFIVAAILVGRQRAGAADRLTYENLRPRFRYRPQAALSADWVGRWLGFVTEGDVPLPEAVERDAWSPGDSVRDIVSMLQTLFRAPEPRWFQGEGHGIRVEAGPSFVVGRSMPRWRRRWRFEVGRAFAVAVEPRLHVGLAATDDAPTIEQLVVDRAGLIAGGDPAIALSAIGPHEQRGRRLVPFAISDALVELWGSVGFGIGDAGRPWRSRRTVL